MYDYYKSSDVEIVTQVKVRLEASQCFERGPHATRTKIIDDLVD